MSGIHSWDTHNSYSEDKKSNWLGQVFFKEEKK